MFRPIYVDIDGTLTSEPEKQWGPPRLDRIQKLKEAISRGDQVVLWTGGGTKYAKEFADRYEIKAICLGKPDLIVDDNPEIRPCLKNLVKFPEHYFGV